MRSDQSQITNLVKGFLAKVPSYHVSNIHHMWGVNPGYIKSMQTREHHIFSNKWTMWKISCKLNMYIQ